MRGLSLAVLSSCFCIGLTLSAAEAHAAQQPGATPSGEFTFEGTVVSTTRNTLIVRSEDDKYQLFVLDDRTTRPSPIPVRAKVRVTFVPTISGETPHATAVHVVSMPPAETTPPPGATPEEPVPATVLKMEQSIQRQVKRFRIGVRAGASLDPEMIVFGVHTQIGPIFSENFFARPNIEFGFGEVTSLIAFNFEGVYRLPARPQGGQWAPFVGFGPSVILSKRSFSTPEGEREPFDFSDFVVDAGLNFLLGIQSRGGTFMELKGSAYALPSIRFMVGFNF